MLICNVSHFLRQLFGKHGYCRKIGDSLSGLLDCLENHPAPLCFFNIFDFLFYILLAYFCWFSFPLSESLKGINKVLSNLFKSFNNVLTIWIVDQIDDKLIYLYKAMKLYIAHAILFIRELFISHYINFNRTNRPGTQPFKTSNYFSVPKSNIVNMNKV